MLFSKDSKYNRILEQFADDPEAIKKELKKKTRQDALLLKETIETQGWQEIIQPFLDKHGDPIQLFKYGDNERKVGKIEAFHNFNRLIKNLMSVLDEKEEDEGDETL